MCHDDDGGIGVESKHDKLSVIIGIAHCMLCSVTSEGMCVYVSCKWKRDNDNEMRWEGTNDGQFSFRLSFFIFIIADGSVQKRIGVCRSRIINLTVVVVESFVLSFPYELRFEI